MAANLEFIVDLVHDACAAVTVNAQAGWRGGSSPDADSIHRAALDHLHGEFAQVISTLDVLATRP